MNSRSENSPLESRPPTLDDLIFLCRELNHEQAKYVVVGGMAIIQQGFVRATEDIDLLVADDLGNIKAIKRALSRLPDNAVREMQDNDVREYGVVRVADEFVVDLLKSACGVDYDEAVRDISVHEIKGVPIPFASVRLLWKMKQTYREKDKLDLHFLREVLDGREGSSADEE